MGGIEYLLTLPWDYSSLLPPEETNRCVGSSKAATDCVFDVYCSHAVEDLHYIVLLSLAQDLHVHQCTTFASVHLLMSSVDVPTVTAAFFFFLNDRRSSGFQQSVINAHHNITRRTCNHKFLCECTHSQSKTLLLVWVHCNHTLKLECIWWINGLPPE